MTKLYKILILLLFCSSCNFGEKKEIVVDLLIFGHSGFCYKDSLNNIYPSDEIFNNDSVKLEYDSTRLDIRQYFEYKKDSFINVAIRRPREKTEYLKLVQLDTIGLEKLINTTLLNRKYKNEYYFNDSTTHIYDGWYYTLYFKTSTNKEFIIDYIPSRLPDSLRTLHNFIEKYILKNNPEMAKRFEYNSMISKEAKRLYKIHRPPIILRDDDVSDE